MNLVIEEKDKLMKRLGYDQPFPFKEAIVFVSGCSELSKILVVRSKEEGDVDYLNRMFGRSISISKNDLGFFMSRLLCDYTLSREMTLTVLLELTLIQEWRDTILRALIDSRRIKVDE